MRARLVILCLLPLAAGCHLRDHSSAARIHHALDRGQLTPGMTLEEVCAVLERTPADGYDLCYGRSNLWYWRTLDPPVSLFPPSPPHSPGALAHHPGRTATLGFKDGRLYAWRRIDADDRRDRDRAALDQHPDNRAVSAERFIRIVSAQSKGDPAEGPGRPR